MFTYQIVKLLQSKSPFKIGQVCVAGSSGKKTTICDSDVDCILFINDKQPPFDDVLDDFENILTMTDSYQIKDVVTTKCSIQFKSSNFDIDILPAANFISNCSGEDMEHFNDLQHRTTLDYIKTDPESLSYVYSGSLAKTTVKFMKRQDGFAHEMVRIVKYWFKTLYFEKKISGAKSLIELVAVFAVIEERKYDSTSYLKCFTRILNYLRNFDDINIVFENEYKFEEHQILDVSRPRVMDPVNPYNNFAKNWDEKAIELLKVYANETYDRLQPQSESNSIRLNRLFDPQPTRISILSEVFPYKCGISKWLIGPKSQKLLLPDLTIRNDNFWREMRFRKGLEILKNYFQLMMHSVIASPDSCTSDAYTCVKDIISRHVINEQQSWVHTLEKHENFDLTFTIPVTTEEAIQISYRL